MKKTLIAVLCAIPLCLVSCASAPADIQEENLTIPPVEIPETEQTEVSENNENVEEASSDQQENSDSEENTSEAENETTENADSDFFPEPEDFVEPEIITLEPQDAETEEPEPVENEPVENEEPPEIILTVTDEETTSSENQESPSDSPENEESAPEENTENLVEDITANDIIIEEKSSDNDNISGGIDITDDDSDSGEEYSEEEEKEIIPSRSITLKKFEYLDVTYPGTGWIYMGLTDNSKDIAYFGRKLGTKDTKFSLQARSAGTKIIHFYRNDPLTGQYLDDYVEVIILPENGSNKTHIDAPEYKLPVQKIEKPVLKTEESEESDEEKKEESEKQTVTEQSESKMTAAKAPVEKVVTEPVKKVQEESVPEKTAENENIENTVSPAANSNPSLLLQDAQVLYNEKEYKAALGKLNQFFEFSTDDRDTALYLKGQILEAKSEVRDIKGAIEAYTTLTKNYPASKYWDSANKRIIYLKRFYLEVR